MLLGIVTLVSEVQPENAVECINLVFSLIIQDVIDVSFAFTSTKYGLLSFPK